MLLYIDLFLLWLLINDRCPSLRHGLASSLPVRCRVVGAAWRGQGLGVEQIRDPVTGALLRLLLNLMLLLCYHLLLLRSKVLRLLLNLMLLLWYYLLLLGSKVLELRNVGLLLMLLLRLRLLCCWSRGFVLFRRRSYRGAERSGGGGGG